MALINKPELQPQDPQPTQHSFHVRVKPLDFLVAKLNICLIICLQKKLTNAATIVGWTANKVIKKPIATDPSSNLMNYVKWL